VAGRGEIIVIRKYAVVCGNAVGDKRV